jgi:uncharacterized SAM-binding protein YcdF (DUF218 family)
VLGGADAFFLLSKALWFFTEPTNLFVALGLIGALLLPTRGARAGRRLLVFSMALLAMCAWSPIGRILLVPLEERFPPWTASGDAPTGIIVLGGGISPTISAARGQPALNDAAERLTAGLELSRTYPNTRIVFSGGSARVISRGESEAVAAGRFLVRMGLPEDRLVLEDRSRNTVENALFSRALAHPQPGERWLLVTSAFHMARSVGVFRAVGFDVEPYPVDWRTRGRPDLWMPFGSANDGLQFTALAVHEWVGLVMYWITGRSLELFPAPAPQGPGCDQAAWTDRCRA